MSDDLAASRSLLLPGPLPPLPHLEVTLCRHVAGAGLRYALYHLGLPPPERPPLRIVRLRPYLDAPALRALLAETPGGPQVAEALLEPDGAGSVAPEARGMRAAAAFHRLRLRVTPPLAPRPVLRPRAGESPDELWRRLRGALSRLMPRVGEAVLAELLASLELRRRRAGGAAVPSSHPLRGRFPAAWRGLLARLAALRRALAEGAAARGVLQEPADADFLPFEVADALAARRAPSWLAAAVRANRAEHAAWCAAPEPPERIAGAGFDR